MKSVFDELNKQYGQNGEVSHNKSKITKKKKNESQVIPAEDEDSSIKEGEEPVKVTGEASENECDDDQTESQVAPESNPGKAKTDVSDDGSSKANDTTHDPSPRDDSDMIAQLREISINAGRTTVELRELRKLYHNEFSGRLQSMQEELGHYREIEKGRIFDDILGDIAKLYAENISILEKIEDVKVKKQLRYMFMDTLQILESYGVSKQESHVGERRNTKFCQVIERIPTDDPEKHDTVAASRSVGFFIENRALVKEMIDVYLYTQPEILSEDSANKMDSDEERG